MTALTAPAVGGVMVAGWGAALPQARVTNEDLTKRLDTSDEWIVERTGIRERRIAGPGESTGPMAVEATRAALARARIPASDVDLVIVATATPERPLPATAAEVVADLGVGAGGFDLNAACAGFVYGLTTTAALLGSGAASTAVLVGADTMSSVVDPDDRSTAILFGDGAAALVLVGGTAPTPESTGAPGLVASDLAHDPAGLDLLAIDAGGSGQPTSAATVAAGRHFLRMDGREVFRRAVRAITESVQRTLDRAGCDPGDLALFVPHQANARIVEAILPRVGISPEHTLRTIDRYGNTSAASIPLSLAEVADAGGLAPGDLVLMCGFGAGMSVGTALWRWDATPATGATAVARGTSGKDAA